MTGADSLSLDIQPVVDLRSPLSLFSGRCGVHPAEGVGRDLGSAAGEGFPISANLTRQRFGGTDSRLICQSAGDQSRSFRSAIANVCY